MADWLFHQSVKFHLYMILLRVPTQNVHTSIKRYFACYDVALLATELNREGFFIFEESEVDSTARSHS